MFPQQGAGSGLATVYPQYLAAATQSGYTNTSHRYLIHTVALYINLTQDPGALPLVDTAASHAAGVVGPLNHPGNQ